MVEVGLLILGAVILIGVIGRLLFERTHLSESLFLILAGILVGPVLGWVPQSFFRDNLSFLVTIALIIVLMDSGLKLDLARTMKNSTNAVIYTLLAGLLTTAVVGIGLHLALGWDLLASILLGAIICGTTTVTVMHLVDRLTTNDKAVLPDTKSIVFIESVISDILTISTVVLLITLTDTGSFSGKALVTLIFNMFIVSTLTGLFFGLCWVFLYAWKLHGNTLSYIFTMGAAIMIFFMAEYLGLNGAVTVVAFCLVIGNHMTIIEHLKVRTKLFEKLGKDVAAMKKTDTEFTFLITTFFFVILGIVFDPQALADPIVVIVAGVIVAAKFVTRSVSCWAMRKAHPSFSKAWLTHTSLMGTGVASAITAFIVIDADHAVHALTEIVLLVIVLSTLVSIMGTALQERHTQQIIEQKAAQH